MAMSASKPTAKVTDASNRPMMVRYCRCQPYESLLHCVRRQPSCVLAGDRGGGSVHRVRIEDEVGEGIAEGRQTEYLYFRSAEECVFFLQGSAYMKQRRRTT